MKYEEAFPRVHLVCHLVTPRYSLYVKKVTSHAFCVERLHLQVSADDNSLYWVACDSFEGNKQGYQLIRSYFDEVKDGDAKTLLQAAALGNGVRHLAGPREDAE